MKNAIFRFYAELNDFLAAEKKSHDFTYSFFGNPAVKDAIEALGVPHPEVDVILANGHSVDFSYQLQQHDRIAVYPTFALLDRSDVTRLRPPPMSEPKFILDVHLGKLAKSLRLLGFDTLYRNDYEDSEIIAIAVNEHRIILTRDLGLFKNKKVTHGHWLRATDPSQQIKEIIHYFDLKRLMNPFSRCLVCNDLIVPISKMEITHRLEPNTKKYFQEFYYCKQCDKIYWRGSHYDNMLRMIDACR